MGREPVASQLLTADQLAERWQVPRTHVYRLTREHAIPAVRLGRYYRYRLDAIETFELDDGNHARARQGSDDSGVLANEHDPVAR